MVLRIIGDMVDAGGEGHLQGKSASQLCANVSEKLFDQVETYVATCIQICD